MVIAFRKYILCVVHLVSLKVAKVRGSSDFERDRQEEEGLGLQYFRSVGLPRGEKSSSKRFKSDPIFAHSTVTKH